MLSSRPHSIRKELGAEEQSDSQNTHKNCPTPKFLKSSPAIRSLKLLLISCSLIQKPPYVPMTDLVDLISKYKDTKEGGVGKKLRHHFAHAGLQQGKLSSSGLPASRNAFSQHLDPLTYNRAKNLSYQFLRSRQLGWNNGPDTCKMSSSFYTDDLTSKEVSAHQVALGEQALLQGLQM